MHMITKDYYTAHEFAALKGVHYKTVYRWVKGGVAPAHEVIGRMLWFERGAADAWQPPRARKSP